MEWRHRGRSILTLLFRASTRSDSITLWSAPAVLPARLLPARCSLYADKLCTYYTPGRSPGRLPTSPALAAS